MPKSSLGLKRILVVDDEAAVTLTLEGFFQNKGYEVLRAFYGDQAIEQIDKHRPALVLLDLQMPGVDGVTVLEKIRQSYPEVKTLVITAHPDLYQEKLEQLKPEVIKLKPISLEDLTRTVESLLGETKSGSPSARVESAVPIRLLFIEGVELLYHRHLKPYFEDPERKLKCVTYLARHPEETFHILTELKPHFVLLDNTRLPIGIEPGRLASELGHAPCAPLEVILYTISSEQLRRGGPSPGQLQGLEAAVGRAAKEHRLH